MNIREELSVFISDERRILYVLNQMKDFTEDEKEKILRETKDMYIARTQEDVKVSFFILVLQMIEKYKKEKERQSMMSLPKPEEKPVIDDEGILKVLKFLKKVWKEKKGIILIPVDIVEKYQLNLWVLNFWEKVDLRYLHSAGRSLYLPCKKIDTSDDGTDFFEKEIPIYEMIEANGRFGLVHREKVRVKDVLRDFAENFDI